MLCIFVRNANVGSILNLLLPFKTAHTTHSLTAVHTLFSYEQAPPGYVKDEEERPEDCIPDEDCNKEAREFLANAPKKGLWMPLGKEVKVMQCKRVVESLFSVGYSFLRCLVSLIPTMH